MDFVDNLKILFYDYLIIKMYKIEINHNIRDIEDMMETVSVVICESRRQSEYLIMIHHSSVYATHIHMGLWTKRRRNFSSLYS